MDMAKEVSDNSHGVYNRGNLPYLAMGRNPAALTAKSFYVFRRFSHTYMLNMARIGVKDKVALAHLLIAPAVIAGAGASILTPLISALLKAVGAGDEPEEEAYLKIAEMFGPEAEKLARFGLAGQAGVSVKGSLAIGIGDLEVFGAPGSVIEDVFSNFPKFMARGNWMKATESILPTGIGNAIRGYREYHHGITTQTNAPVFYGREPLKLSWVEAYLRGFSLNPARIAMAREKQYKESVIRGELGKWKTDIHAKMKGYRYTGSQDAEAWAEILGERDRFNERAVRWGIPPITPKSMNSMLKRSMKPSKQERMREVQ